MPRLNLPGLVKNPILQAAFKDILWPWILSKLQKGEPMPTAQEALAHLAAHRQTLKDGKAAWEASHPQT